MVSREEALRIFEEVHHGRYSYGELPETIRSHDLIPIICKEHGSFMQEYRKHANGCGCKHCSAIANNKKRMLSPDELIKRFRAIHGDRFSYEKMDYKGFTRKIEIICPIHGSFQQTPAKHLRGDGCPKCRLKYKNTEDFIRACRSIHPELDYTKTVYVNSNTPSTFTCSVHGDFRKFPYCVAKRGEGCPKCSHIEKSKKQCNTTEGFKDKCRRRGIDKHYDLSSVSYVNSNERVNVICHEKYANGSEHGVFSILPQNLLAGYGCPRCRKGRQTSDLENEMASFIENNTEESVIRSDSKTLDGLEIDVLIPSLRLAFEFDGLYWHSELKKPDDYHINKTKECEKIGLRLIHVFEDEWVEKKDIVKGRILNLLKKTPRRVYARNCEILPLAQKECDSFMNENHLQGAVNAKYRFGLKCDGEIVSVMLFSGLRKNVGHNKRDGAFEILRFCNKTGTTVVGGASKLFKYFIKTVKPSEIISYSDRRWGNGEMYSLLGFKMDHETKQNYYYVIGHSRENRFKYRKDRLVGKGYDHTKTEHEIMLERGIYRIYDCGCKVWKWVQNKKQR